MPVTSEKMHQVVEECVLQITDRHSTYHAQLLDLLNNIIALEMRHATESRWETINCKGG
jgi:hypothetical protein